MACPMWAAKFARDGAHFCLSEFCVAQWTQYAHFLNGLESWTIVIQVIEVRAFSDVDYTELACFGLKCGEDSALAVVAAI